MLGEKTTGGRGGRNVKGEEDVVKKKLKEGEVKKKNR